MARSRTIIYPPFPSYFIHAAILLAYFAGINLGSHVAYVLGFDLSLGRGYYAFIQTHGHVQLMGWAGLFIMGVSLHLLPRLTHTKMNPHTRSKVILRLMVTGLIIRVICNSFLPYASGSPWFKPISLLTLLSGTLVFFSVLYYLFLIAAIIKSAIKSNINDNRNIRIFILLTLIGWLIYALGNQILLIEMYISTQSTVLQNWNVFFIEFFIHFTILSICISVGLRTLPLYMRLSAVKWNVEKFAWIFSILLFIIFGGKFIFLFYYSPVIGKIINISSMLKDGLIIWFIFKLNILYKTQRPWVDSMAEERIPHRREPRENLPDYGEYGRFEWLIKPAFFWLLIGLSLDIIIQFSILTRRVTEITPDGVRHIILLGFISLLIMGMAVRMIPGMMGIRRLTRPKWVIPLSIIVNISVIFRVFTLVLPANLISGLPGGSSIYNRIFGLSGLMFLIGLMIFYYIMVPVLNYRKD